MPEPEIPEIDSIVNVGDPNHPEHHEALAEAVNIIRGILQQPEGRLSEAELSATIADGLADPDSVIGAAAKATTRSTVAGDVVSPTSDIGIAVRAVAGSGASVVATARRAAAQAAMPTLREQARRLNAGKTATWRNAESWNVRAMTRQGRRLVYVLQHLDGCKVGYSDDDGATRPISVKTFAATTEAVCKALLVTNDGEVIVVLSQASGAYQSVIYRSTGFDADPATATWAKVFTTPSAQPVTAPAQIYGGLAYDGDATVAGAWYDAKTNSGGTIIGDNAGVRVRRSVDKGVTWTTVFNLRDWLIANGVPNPDANTNGFHVHGIEYDRYSDGWVLSYGDTNGTTGESGILYFSKDFTTVTPLHRGTTHQAVGIICLPDCILLGGDGGVYGGHSRIPRRPDGSFGAPEKAYTLNNGIALGDNNPPVGGLLLWCHTQIGGSTPLSRLVATADGYVFYELFTDATYTVNSTNGLNFVVGPTASGKIIASSGNDGRYTSATPASSWSELVITPT